jgi:hypothetical protein
MGGVCLRAFAIGVLLCSATAVQAADEGWTDRIIVKYRTVTAAAAAQTTGDAAVSARRFGLGLNPVRTTALGSQVLKADRRMSLTEAQALARDIAAGREGKGDTTTLEDYSILAKLRVDED